MIIRKLRLQRAWSQEHLADLSGLSSRTIQRIEKGDKPGLESIRLLADVFEIDPDLLQDEISNSNKNPEKEGNMETNSIRVTNAEKEALEYVRSLKSFYKHLFIYVVVIAGLVILNIVVSPHNLWVLWVIFGWGIGIVIRAVKLFSPFGVMGPEWEKMQVEKRLGREL